MAALEITLKDFAELKQQVGELHGSLYRNGFRQDIKELKDVTAQNAEIIQSIHEYTHKLNHRIDLFEAQREHTCPVAKQILVTQKQQKELTKEFWQKLLTKTRFWLVVLGFLGLANLGDVIYAIQSVIGR